MLHKIQLVIWLKTIKIAIVTSATRTSAKTTSTGNSFLNMGTTAWSLLIIAILGIITVALVWYYGKQNEFNVHQNRNNNNDNY